MLGNPLNKLQNSLASLLNIENKSIIILTVRSVFRYQTPFDPPKTLEEQKAEAQTDVVFYVINRERLKVTNELREKQPQFQSLFQIQVVEIAPDPCRSYGCPSGNENRRFYRYSPIGTSTLIVCIFSSDTFCRATRTIHPRPNMIDANVTSFVGINILDSADCVALPSSSTDCSSASLLSDAISPSSPLLLELTFDEKNLPYAEYNGTTFSTLAPTRFSFDFLVSSLPTNALVLLYGRNSIPIDEFLWIAVEILGSNLKFHFPNQQFLINDIELKSSTWYHVECQVDSLLI